jgi:hypothetical protein
VLAVGLVWGFGTLLGPEKTSWLWGVFSGRLRRGRLTLTGRHGVWWVVWVVVLGVVGCGCLLSVA